MQSSAVIIQSITGKTASISLHAKNFSTSVVLPRVGRRDRKQPGVVFHVLSHLPHRTHALKQNERLYHRKLRELRIAFGRDPDTGRKIRTVGKMAKSMQFVVDTREKRPWDFTDAIHMALKTGDYSLVGYEDTVAIERKSYDDIYQCLTVRRYNFCRQLRRLGKLKRAYLLIECSASAFLLGHIQHKLTGDKALLRLVKYTNEYGVPFCFCDRKGKELAEKILYCWWEELNAKQS